MSSWIILPSATYERLAQASSALQKGLFGVAILAVSSDHRVPGDGILLQHLVEELSGALEAAVLAVSSDHRIPSDNRPLLQLHPVEDLPSFVEAAEVPVASDHHVLGHNVRPRHPVIDGLGFSKLPLLGIHGDDRVPRRDTLHRHALEQRPGFRLATGLGVCSEHGSCGQHRLVGDLIVQPLGLLQLPVPGICCDEGNPGGTHRPVEELECGASFVQAVAVGVHFRDMVQQRWIPLELALLHKISMELPSLRERLGAPDLLELQSYGALFLSQIRHFARRRMQAASKNHEDLKPLEIFLVS